VLTCRTGRDVRAALAGRGRVGLVPTMGALHAGHEALLDAARADADVLVMSLFVNPTQFAAGEDYDRYPRDEGADAAAAERAGVDVLFAPGVEEMYPAGASTSVDPGPLGELLEGRFRPGHFRGVATVVTRLFTSVRPDVAWFGEKDWQQLVVIRRVVRDLDLGVEVRGVPTVRDPSGLAFSSRNVMLSNGEHEQAASLSQALFAARDLYASGERDAGRLLAAAGARIAVEPQYLELAQLDSLAPYDPDRDAVLAVAARVGSTRLIDNVKLERNHS
jgi:pantoate--beta-alanine ligase